MIGRPARDLLSDDTAHLRTGKASDKHLHFNRLSAVTFCLDQALAYMCVGEPLGTCDPHVGRDQVATRLRYRRYARLEQADSSVL